jgi:chemotaxis protein methyltransferase CheR
MTNARAITMPTLTERDFALIQDLVHRKSGIFLGEHKRALVIGRLSRRMRELGLTTLSAYYDVVMQGGDAELTRLLDAICTNETRFFRESDHFAFLESRALGELEELAASGRIPKRIRVWSAACSSGEEPYSLAMTLRARFPRSSGWQIEIIASDLSTRILDRAREAIWPIQKAGDIPYEHLKRFMLRGTSSQEGKMKAGAEIRDLVEFRRINLNDETYPVEGKFDFIFCRNVLIYFERTGKANVARRLLAKLCPHGYLFLGHAETLAGISDEARSVGPSVYQLKLRAV